MFSETQNLNGMKQFKYLFLTCFFILLACKKTEEKTSLQKTFTIYTIGDSTMANKPNPEENPERGWGQMLPQFFNENVKIENEDETHIKIYF